MSLFRFCIDVSQSLPWPPSTRPSKELTQEWARSHSIQPTLRHLSEEEQTAVTRFYHAADASRCLGSYLLKHLAIMHGCSVPWSQSQITQERHIRNGKPFYAPGGVEFNVSHQGKYVVCVGSTIPEANVGIDVVQIDVEKDQKRIDSTGIDEWIDAFSDVLSAQEKARTVSTVYAEGTEAGLRLFYTIWACKEAYIKMTSDALMATWINELMFPQLQVPDASADLFGQPIFTNVVLQGRQVEGVKIELVAVGPDYIVATATDCKHDLPPFEVVKVSSTGAALECFAKTTDHSASHTFPLGT